MSIRNWCSSLSLFWKTFVFLVFLTTLVVGLAEGILEPAAQYLLLELSGGFKPWHEAIMWGVSIIIPSLLCGFIFSRALAEKVGAMATAADKLARGNFSIRIGVREPSRDAFEHLGKSFNAMASSLENLMANERRLLTDISHELRSPLARMGIALELMPLKKDETSREQLVARLDKEVSHMSALVELLLAQGRERLFSLGREDEIVNLSALLREVADDLAFHGQLEDKKILAAIPEGVMVAGQTALMRTMLMNVGVNALFYTPSGTSVYLYLIREAGFVCIHVRDYGPGVPEDQLDNIFRAFYRVDDSRDRTTGGAGLGLALAREAATVCGGTITARNADPGLEVRMRFAQADAAQIHSFSAAP